MNRRLDRLLNPGRIAVVGGRAAERVVAQCDKMGFEGPIWPVNPRRAHIGGRPCLASVAELPSPPDAAFIGVNRHETIEIVAALAQQGAGGAVCYASGFRESEEASTAGGDLQDRLIAAAGDMPVIGPNCYGFVNALDAVPLWPDQHGLQRESAGVAIVAQSSNIAINLSMQRRGLPIAYLATVGNQAQTGLSDFAASLLADDRVTALGLYVEGFDDVTAFERLTRYARERRKPIVILKVGKSNAACAAARSHTAALVGSDAVSDALFHRLGVARVSSLPALIETLKLLHVHGPLPSADICSMSCSGGEAALIADAAVMREVRFPPLAEDVRRRLGVTLGNGVALANPLDYHTHIWGDEARLADCFIAMMGGAHDLAMLVLDYPRQDRCDSVDWDIAESAARHAARESRGRLAVVSSLPETFPEARARALLDDGVAPLCGIDEALAAAEAAAHIGQAWSLPAPAPLLPTKTATGSVRSLDEADAKHHVAAMGIAVPEGRVAETPEAAAAMADALGFPVALKALGFTHKSDVDAVQLGLTDPDAVRRAADAMPNTGAGFLVERMVEDGTVELMLGIARDPLYGLSLSIASGGVLVELFGDVVTLMLPVGPDEIRAAILRLRCAPLLIGFRGQAPADLDAAVAAAAALAGFAADHAARIEEIEINPLIVQARGAVAVDAVIRLREEES